MSWISHHQRSQLLAIEAHEALRQGDAERARSLFIQAAQNETSALEEVPPEKIRTLGITAISAASLWYKSGDLATAEQVAHRALAISEIPQFAFQELRELLQVIWNEQAQAEAGIRFVPGQVVVSVKGGEVVTGGAPLDLILRKVQAVQNIYFRTAEFLKKTPLRRKGPPSRELQEVCRPWLFQGVPGSYQFAVAIQKPAQAELFPSDEPEPEVLTETFLTILRAAGDDPEGSLKEVVPDPGYRQTFLKMTRNLAPTGKTFSQMEIRGTGERSPIILSPASRKIISETLRQPKTGAPKSTKNEVCLDGVLRAVHLDRDWLEVTVNGVHLHVRGVGEAVDDVIGPMVNHEVHVRAERRGRGFKFIDIELDE
jgi:hypothetical protein